MLISYLKYRLFLFLGFFFWFLGNREREDGLYSKEEMCDLKDMENWEREPYLINVYLSYRVVPETRDNLESGSLGPTHRISCKVRERDSNLSSVWPGF